MTTTADALAVPARQGLSSLVLARFARHRPAVASVVVIACLGLGALLADRVSPRDPLRIELAHKFAAPLTKGHLLGADELGRDVLSRLLHAGRISLSVGLAAMAVTVVVGTVLGSVAGYFGRSLDAVLLRLTDAMLSFPPIFMLLALAAFVRPSLPSMTVIIAVTSWMDVTRMVRGQVLSLREQEFVTGARALGAGAARIMVRHLFPNTVGIIAVAATLSVARAILLESYISFLGYGIQPPLASWGNMLNNAQSYFSTAPWVAIFPGLVITLAVTSFNFLGDGLRDALDPRSVQSRA
ncbi:MAG: ABC transporter permease [Candidatus Rokubacteria bacterium]|nr:ABC transporter permease [Candidatus Rokubacteria bacterium]